MSLFNAFRETRRARRDKPPAVYLSVYSVSLFRRKNIDSQTFWGFWRCEYLKNLLLRGKYFQTKCVSLNSCNENPVWLL